MGCLVPRIDFRKMVKLNELEQRPSCSPADPQRRKKCFGCLARPLVTRGGRRKLPEKSPSLPANLNSSRRFLNNRPLRLNKPPSGLNNRPVRPANRTVRPANRKVRVSNLTAQVSNLTAQVSNRTAQVSNRTVRVSNLTVRVSDRTVRVSNRKVHAANRTVRPTNRTVRHSHCAVEQPDRTVVESEGKMQILHREACVYPPASPMMRDAFLQVHRHSPVDPSDLPPPMADHGGSV